jgi:digeranylgeranylglycerophospholipid reductase
MANDIDVLVAGGGTTGLIFSGEVKSNGLETILLEKEPEIGLPSHCSGLVSINGLKIIGIEPPSGCIENVIYGAKIHSPSNHVFKIESKKPLAYALDRPNFDKFLAKRAISKGVKILLNKKATHLLKKNDDVIGLQSSDGDELYSKITISAEGVAGHLQREAGLQSLNRSFLIPALQFDLRNVEIDRHTVQIFFKKRYSSNFFAWIIPTGKDRARAGLASNEQNNLERLNLFVHDKLNSAEVSSMFGGIITLGGPINKTCSKGFLAIGDVCGQTKSTTGGGIVTGGICAKIAAEAVKASIKKNDASYDMLKSNYEEKWREKLGKEFSLMLKARKILNTLSEHTLDRIFRTIIESNISEDISESSDMDLHSDTIMRIIKRSFKGKIVYLVIRDIINNFIKERF